MNKYKIIFIIIRFDLLNDICLSDVYWSRCIQINSKFQSIQRVFIQFLFNWLTQPHLIFISIHRYLWHHFFFHLNELSQPLNNIVSCWMNVLFIDVRLIKPRAFRMFSIEETRSSCMWSVVSHAKCSGDNSKTLSFFLNLRLFVSFRYFAPQINIFQCGTLGIDGTWMLLVLHSMYFLPFHFPV